MGPYVLLLPRTRRFPNPPQSQSPQWLGINQAHLLQLIAVLRRRHYLCQSELMATPTLTQTILPRLSLTSQLHSRKARIRISSRHFPFPKQLPRNHALWFLNCLLRFPALLHRAKSFCSNILTGSFRTLMLALNLKAFPLIRFLRAPILLNLTSSTHIPYPIPLLQQWFLALAHPLALLLRTVPTPLDTINNTVGTKVLHSHDSLYDSSSEEEEHFNINDNNKTALLMTLMTMIRQRLLYLMKFTPL